MRTFALLCSAALAAATQRVTVPAGFCGNEPFEAGYITIDASKNKEYFYYYFKSLAPTNQTLLWETGGPGCSSGLALLMENGPCKVAPGGGSTVANPYGWNAQANVVWVDQPGGVGYSVSDTDGYDTNEAQVSADMWIFLQGFYKLHPELLGAEQQFAVFGESYGGHFAPATAYRIFQNNQNLAPGEVKIPLTHLGVGNGLTQPLIQYQYYPEMVWDYAIQDLGYPLVSRSTYNSMVAAVPQCVQLIQACQNDTSQCPTAQSYCNDYIVGPYSATGRNSYDIRLNCTYPPLCYDIDDINTFMNSAATQQALGVASRNISWAACNFLVNEQFSNDWSKDFGQYVATLVENGVKALIYAGTQDFVCNWLGNAAWTYQLEWSGQAGFQAAKTLEFTAGPVGLPAGTVRNYGNLYFVKVYGAGHLAPMDRPVTTLHMLNSFLQDIPLA